MDTLPQSTLTTPSSDSIASDKDPAQDQDSLIRVWVAGTCEPSECGGWAFIAQRYVADRIVEGGVEKSGSPTHAATQPAMMMQAIIEALKHISRSEASPIYIYTALDWIIDAMCGDLQRWEANGWKTNKGKDIKNPDLWKEIRNLSANRDIKWERRAGHESNPQNKRVKELAEKAKVNGRVAFFSAQA